MEENNVSQTNSNGMSIASLILGIIGLVAWILPLLGYPINIIGIILGIISNKKEKNKFSKTGIILSAIGLGITAINSIAGVIMVLSQLPQ